MSGTPTESQPRPPEAAARPAVRLPRQRRPPRRRAPVVLSASVTAGWAALLSYCAVLLVVGLLAAVTDGTTAAGTVRLGTAGWLLAHGVPVGTPIGQLSLVPLTVTALAAWRVARAGVHTSRAIGGRRHGSPRLAGIAAVAVAAAYGLLGTVAAALARTPGLDLHPVRAGFTMALVGLVAAGAGAAYDAGLAAAGWRLVPAVVRDGMRTGTVAALLLLAAGAGLAGVAVAVSGGDVADTLGGYRTGVAGQAGLSLLCLVYAPDLAGWAAAYLVGPGFTVGVGTTVSVASVHLGALPAVPVLAAVPDRAVAGLGALLLGIPVAGGMAAGALLARREIHRRGGYRQVPWGSLLGAAAIAGPVAGLLLGLAGWASGGGLGSGRLGQLGPDPWWLVLIGTGMVAFGAMAAAASTRVLVAVRSG